MSITLVPAGRIASLERLEPAQKLAGADAAGTRGLDRVAQSAVAGDDDDRRRLGVGAEDRDDLPVGGLRTDLGVGTFLCPDDFIALHLGLSLSDQHDGERVPGFDPPWRASVLAAWNRVAEPDVVDGGVYWQAIGPRFETPAEIRLIAAHADVIGMTIASEAIIAGELGIPYAAVCVVDNLANGIAEAPLSVSEFEAGKEENRSRLTTAIGAVAAELETAAIR
jgi:hypothetical protein